MVHSFSVNKVEVTSSPSIHGADDDNPIMIEQKLVITVVISV